MKELKIKYMNRKSFLKTGLAGLIGAGSIVGLELSTHKVEAKDYCQLIKEAFHAEFVFLDKTGKYLCFLDPDRFRNLFFHDRFKLSCEMIDQEIDIKNDVIFFWSTKMMDYETA